MKPMAIMYSALCGVAMGTVMKLLGDYRNLQRRRSARK